MKISDIFSSYNNKHINNHILINPLIIKEEERNIFDKLFQKAQYTGNNSDLASKPEPINPRNSEETLTPCEIEIIKKLTFHPDQTDDTQFQKRSLPPLGPSDTVVWNDGQPKSVYGEGILFNDEEIVTKKPISQKVPLGSCSIPEEGYRKIYALYTEHQKAIIQQQGIRGCSAAVTAMLIVDHKRTPDLTQLITRNLGTAEIMKKDIQDAGLTPLTSSVNNLQNLRMAIGIAGSAIVSLGNALYNHVVIVDEINEDLSEIRLRDPYHGWEITVTNKAFLKEWQKDDEIIQIQERL